jgi:hypothetical protein
MGPSSPLCRAMEAGMSSNDCLPWWRLAGRQMGGAIVGEGGRCQRGRGVDRLEDCGGLPHAAASMSSSSWGSFGAWRRQQRARCCTTAVAWPGAHAARMAHGPRRRSLQPYRGCCVFTQGLMLPPLCPLLLWLMRPQDIQWIAQSVYTAPSTGELAHDSMSFGCGTKGMTVMPAWRK